MLNDDELQRYSRQILLPQLDVAGQEKLRRASVLIAGLGGLGCPVALYLAAAGVGRLVLADGDRVELSNLQRQLAHAEADIGSNKAASAAAAVRALNSDTEVEVIARQLDSANLTAVLAGVDLVVDATDNYAARYALNRGCIDARLPLVSAAAIRLEGQLAVFDTAAGGACYRCLYPAADARQEQSCSTNGVLGPVVGVLGSLQALEAIKRLAGLGQAMRDALLIVDFQTLECRRLNLTRRADCPDCASQGRW